MANVWSLYSLSILLSPLTEDTSIQLVPTPMSLSVEGGSGYETKQVAVKQRISSDEFSRGV